MRTCLLAILADSHCRLCLLRRPPPADVFLASLDARTFYFLGQPVYVNHLAVASGVCSAVHALTRNRNARARWHVALEHKLRKGARGLVHVRIFFLPVVLRAFKAHVAIVARRCFRVAYRANPESVTSAPITPRDLCHVLRIKMRRNASPSGEVLDVLAIRNRTILMASLSPSDLVETSGKPVVTHTSGRPKKPQSALIETPPAEAVVLPPELRQPLSQRLGAVLADPRSGACTKPCPICSRIPAEAADAALAAWDALARAGAWPIPVAEVRTAMGEHRSLLTSKALNALLGHRRHAVLHRHVRKELEAHLREAQSASTPSSATP